MKNDANVVRNVIRSFSIAMTIGTWCSAGLAQLSTLPVHVKVIHFPTAEAQIQAAKTMFVSVPRSATSYDRTVAVANAVSHREFVATAWPKDTEAITTAAITEADIFAAVGLWPNAESVLVRTEGVAKTTG